ncbi:tRNA cytosine(34) acetyltransferase TmcA [Oceaniserpentilla sp. 4NH20-0058]|uniref:GNAT family N-acetyltransferase n=1 Tax=Oceaniserpentilla sp. 4NH20-0058 TaxID=3127660 RepID=UPI003106B93F
MLPWLSQLSEYRANQKARQVIWLAGDHHWAWSNINHWLSLHKHNIYVGQAELRHAYLTCVKASKPSTLLGYECDNVVFDAHHGLFPDALTAISGTIKAGGVLFLLTPPLEQWPEFEDEFAKGRTSLGFEDQCKNPLTTKRLIHFAKKAQRANQGVIILEQHTEFNLSPDWLHEWQSVTPNLNTPANSTTDDQTDTLQYITSNLSSLESHLFTSYVITADRGRGKSHLLGMIAENLINLNKDNGINYYLCAPNKAATTAVYKHLSETTKQALQFLAPERLTETASPDDIIFIDEAASLPIGQLIEWSSHFKRLIFASTTHGYEGTGKGFQIRFFNYLEQLSLSPLHTWKHLTLSTPVRFSQSDPLERWLFKSFCLDSEPSALKLVEKNKVSNEYQSEHLNNKSLTKTPHLLEQVFALLVQAHYQTKPSDLRDLLDAPGLELFIQTIKHKEKKHVISVCLINDEGPIPSHDERSNNLHEEIYKGYRRPKGHLIPQVLAHHLGQYQAFNLKGARVVRIATLPPFQQLGLASRLLSFAIAHLKTNRYDYIGSSYANTKDVTYFWMRNQFKIIRQGNKLDKSSGTQSALVIYGLSQKGLKLEQDCLNFHERQHQAIDSISELKPTERNLLNAFLEHNGSYESAKMILQRFNNFNMAFPKKASKDFKSEIKNWLEDNQNSHPIQNT